MPLVWHTELGALYEWGVNTLGMSYKATEVHSEDKTKGHFVFSFLCSWGGLVQEIVRLAN